MKNEQDWNDQLKFSSSDDHDREQLAYRKVYDALAQEPEFKLPSHFSDQIIQRLSTQQQKSSTRDTLYLIMGSVLMVITAIAGAWLAGFKPDMGVFKFLSGYGGLVIFGTAFILGLHWLDKKVVSKKIA